MDEELQPGDWGTHEHPSAVGERELRERQTDSWYRELNDGRVEVMCRAPGVRIRVSAPEQQAWRFVELFEEMTGLVVQSDRRPPRVFAPPRGQLSMTELESEGNDGEG